MGRNPFRVVVIYMSPLYAQSMDSKSINMLLQTKHKHPNKTYKNGKVLPHFFNKFLVELMIYMLKET